MARIFVRDTFARLAVAGLASLAGAGCASAHGTAGGQVDAAGVSTSGQASTISGASQATTSAGASQTTTSAGASQASSAGLQTNVAPGGNFDLSIWQLQEPVGSPGNPTTIGPAALAGPNGYHDAYFFTDPSDGAMTFWDPENGVTTANSNYPRSELRELNADGSAANWALAGTNVLSATVAVSGVPDHVCIGQIHIGTAIQSGLAASTKPLCELYYYANGDISLGVENDPTGGQTVQKVANVPLGTRFTYAIALTGNDSTISLSVNGATTTFSVPTAFAGYGEYFKAGDYDQTAGTDATIGATVKLYALTVTHGP